VANRAEPLRRLERAGAGLAALVGLAVLGPLLAVGLAAEGPARLGPADGAAIRFTLLQAALSASVSVALAVPVARALARRRFRGRRAFVALTGAPFILPVIVAVLGLLAIFGRAGWLNDLLQRVGVEPVSVYGLGGIVLAHVFLNLPLVVRLLLQAWLAVPSERFRLAASLGFGARDMHRQFERPILRAVLPGAFVIVFLICASSFAVALILGGGPRATTLELAIYQAFRFEFDLGRAALLGVIQAGICLLAGAVALWLARPGQMGAGLDRRPQAWPGDSAGARAADGLWIVGAGLFLTLPLAAILGQGLLAVTALPGEVWRAALRSIAVALVSTGLAVALALPIGLLVARGRTWLEAAMALTISVSPLVIGTGAFLLLFPLADPVGLALPVTAVVNALVALPFVLRGLVPAIREAEASQGRLAEALGLGGWTRLRLAILPRLRRPLGFGAGLAAAFSMGDLGVIALFSAPGQATLPMEMYRLMGSYRTDDAEGAAVLLTLLALGLFLLFDRGGRVDARG
jgi:thiamine transport system permease protein